MAKVTKNSVPMGEFGSDNFPGLLKLIEEAGELIQVCGKLMAVGGDETHWNRTSLYRHLEYEMGDVTAAITFVLSHDERVKNGAVKSRVTKKFRIFEGWHKKAKAEGPGRALNKLIPKR